MRASGHSRVMARVAWNPSRCGICMSIRTQSGRHSRYAATAAAPSAHSKMVEARSSTTLRMVRRISAWSSAISRIIWRRTLREPPVEENRAMYLFCYVHVRTTRAGSELRLVVERELHEGVAALKIQSRTDIGPVGLDRAAADMEGVADLAARLVLGEEGQDAAFGRGQAVEVGGRGQRAFADAPPHEMRGQRRARVMLSGGHRPDRTEDVARRRILQDVALDAEAQRLVEQPLVAMHGQE